MAQRGRKPKPTAVKVLEGNPGKRSLNTAEPKPEKKAPRCPSWLEDEAKKEWKRMSKQLEQLGILTEIDMTAFAGYCQAYARWKEAEEFITQHGTIVKTPSGYWQQVPQVSTKSISRFARNTLDCLNYVRELKDLGIGIIFEKENINTLDAKGEVLLTILSSLAQDESRSISENCTWGIRRRFETGKHKMSTKRFLGYDTDETGKLVINRTQEPIVVRLYQEFMDGKTTDYIKRIFEREGVKNWDGGTKWQSTTLMSMLENEKYKGDALLQKSYTVDFLTKKRTQNKGEIQMFYVEDDHDAIISKRIWECVQLEIKRRKKYLEEHGTNSYSHRPESNPFASKIICGDCNKVFARKGWRSSTGVDRKVWQCSERYKVKGVMGCANRHVEEETLIKAYLMAWNALVENREDFMEQWTEQLQSENLLESYRAEKFIEYTDGAKPLTEMDTDFMLKTLDHIKVFEDGTLLVVFLDGTEIECKNEEE